MEKLPNIHPGEVLLEDFLKPLEISQYRLAKDIGVGRVRIGEIIRGERDITPDTAVRLGLYFGIEPETWLNLQARYNLLEARERLETAGISIRRCEKLEALEDAYWGAKADAAKLAGGFIGHDQAMAAIAERLASLDYEGAH